MELMAFKRMHDDGILNFEREKKTSSSRLDVNSNS